MKHLCLVFLALFFVSSAVFAADFVPTAKLDISVNDFVQYDFNGSAKDIPVQIMGTPGRAYLMIETTGLKGVLPRITNGRVGWHTVNSIDTTVYFSAGKDLQTGSQYITWPGTDQDGNALAEGTYTYYVYAFDYMNLMQPATPIKYNDIRWAHLKVTAADENGVPFPKPLLTALAFSAYGDGSKIASRDWFKWTLGNDPRNMELFETCSIPTADGWTIYSNRCPFDATDYNYIYNFQINETESQQAYYKWMLNPNGTAEMEDWGTDLRYNFETGGGHYSGCDTDGTYLYAPVWLYSKSSCNSHIVIASCDGDKVEEIYLTDWDKAAYVQEHGEVLQAGGPTSCLCYEGKYYMNSIWCMVNVCDPVKYIDSVEYDDFIMAINEEGDGYNDKGFSADNPFPDYCFAEDPPWNYSYYATSYGLSFIATQRAGPISFTIFAPDLTAVDYAVTAGVTDTGLGIMVPMDFGGAYDGMYVNHYGVDLGDDAAINMWYLGSDVGKGVIAKTDPGTGVAAAAPAAFAVAQSSPNPANPTTTISFSIPEAGTVNVDVFNVAGQKVDTLVNNFMDAGSHSIVWDGSSLASGVYFYTVTSGEFSKTMKMTLLK